MSFNPKPSRCRQTELRQKMIRAMELKNLSPHTRRAYPAAVSRLARHYL